MSPFAEVGKQVDAKWRRQQTQCSTVCVAGRWLPVGRDSLRIYIPQPLSDHPRKSLYLMGTETWSPICSDQPAAWQTAALSIFLFFSPFGVSREEENSLSCEGAPLLLDKVPVMAKRDLKKTLGVSTWRQPCVELIGLGGTSNNKKFRKGWNWKCFLTNVTSEVNSHS